MKDLITKQTAALMSPGGGMSLYRPESLRGEQETLDAEDKSADILKNILSILKKSLIVQEDMEASVRKLADSLGESSVATVKKESVMLNAPTTRRETQLLAAPTTTIRSTEESKKPITTEAPSEQQRETLAIFEKQTNLLEGILSALGGGKPTDKTAVSLPNDQTEQERETLAIFEKQTSLLEAILGVLSEKPEQQKKEAEKSPLGGLLTSIAVVFGALFGAISGYVKAIVKMNKALFSVFESIVGFLTKKFPSIFGGLQKLLTGIENSFIGSLETIKGKLSSMAEKAVKIVDVVNEKAVKIVDAVKDFFGGIAAKIMDSKAVKFITDIFGNITGVFKNFIGSLETIKGKLSSMAEKAVKIVDAVKDFFGGIAAKIMDSKAVKFITDIFGGLQKLLTGIENSFIGGLETIKGKLSSMAEKAVKIVDVAKDFFGSLETIKGKLSSMAEKAVKIVDVAKDFFGGIAAKIMDSKAVKFITDIIGNITGVFKNFFGDIGKEIKVIEGVASPLTDIIKGIKGSFGKFFGFFESMFSFFTDIGKSVSSFGSIFSSVAKIISKIAYPLTIIMSVWDTVKGAIEGYQKEGIVGLFSGAIKGLLSSIIGGPLDLIKDLSSWVLKKLGFDEASKFLESFSFDEIIKTFVDAVFSPIETLKSIFGKLMGFLEEIEIPEISFTIPIINKKVSIGPFRPFKKEKSDKVEGAPSAGGTAAPSTAPSTVPPSAGGTAAPSTAPSTVPPSTSGGTTAPSTSGTAAPLTSGGTTAATAAPLTAPSTSGTAAPSAAPLVALSAPTSAGGNAPPSAALSAPPTASGNATATISASNEAAKQSAATASAPVVISAPSTNVQNSQNVTIPQPVRNPDMSFNRYMSRGRVIV